MRGKFDGSTRSADCPACCRAACGSTLTVPAAVGFTPRRLRDENAHVDAHVRQGNSLGTMQSLKGQLLLSGGALFDTNFRHTAVLIAEHGTWGAVGIILNRPMDIKVCDV